jgi:hypothetical protein
MALKGSIKDFSLNEIFQLITMGKKTGALVVKGAEQTGTIYFQEGGIYAAFTQWKTVPLHERVQRNLKLRKEDFEKFLKDSQASSKKLGEYLIEKKVTTAENLKKILAEHLADTLFDIFTWKEGDFYFEPGKVHDESDWGIFVDVPTLMEITEARLDEWRKIKEKIPTLSTCYKISLKPAEEGKEITLKPLEWKALYYLNGENSVTEIADLLNLSEFEACRVLYRLVAEGMVEEAGKKEITKLREEALEEERREVPAEEGVEEAKEERAEEKTDEVVEELTEKITSQLMGEKKEEVEVEVEKKEEVPEEELEEMLQELTSLTETEGEVQKEGGESSEAPRISLDKNVSRDVVMKVIRGIKRL